MSYWVIYLDTFEGRSFPLYGPIVDRDDAQCIADAKQAEMRDGWVGDLSLMDKVFVWGDDKKVQYFGYRAALYPTLPEGGAA